MKVGVYCFSYRRAFRGKKDAIIGTLFLLWYPFVALLWHTREYNWTNSMVLGFALDLN